MKLKKHTFINEFSISDLEQVKLRAALERLSKTEKKLLELRFWEHQSIQEISEATHLSWSEVDYKIERTLKKLRRFILSRGCPCMKRVYPISFQNVLDAEIWRQSLTSNPKQETVRS